MLRVRSRLSTSEQLLAIFADQENQTLGMEQKKDSFIGRVRKTMRAITRKNVKRFNDLLSQTIESQPNQPQRKKIPYTFTSQIKVIQGYNMDALVAEKSSSQDSTTPLDHSHLKILGKMICPPNKTYRRLEKIY